MFVILGDRWRATLLTAAVLLAASASAGAVPVAAPAGTTGSAVLAGLPISAPQFVGTVEEFYEVPQPLPPGVPGELIRVQDVGSSGGRTTVRIMYHSTDPAGRDRAVTGIATVPDASPPPGGWPVVSIANGTVGLASNCALSRHGWPAPTFGIDAIAVASDYIGLGPVGERHPYLSRTSEGNSVIDAVRAVRNLMGDAADDRWLVVGASQGGHGSLSAAELAAARAPELELLGAVSLAPAAMLERTYGPIDEIVARVVGVMALYGAETEHPQIDANDYVGPQTAAAAAAVFPDQCLPAIIAAFAPIPAEDFYVADPRVTEPARSLMLANDVGNATFDAPLLLGASTADEIVVIERARDLAVRVCTTGQHTQYVEVDGALHGEVMGAFGDRITAFFTARLDGAPAPDNCDEVLATHAVPPPPPPPVSTASPQAAVPAATGPAFTG